ncbi:hypothetical protein RDV64_15665 [Acuticoccus sp. MNP-M23]|uniref:hypothetical protein n=1 Tax=Acuticoccus sp. MNP-M23 TaxID=3072793 RepID=UPI0028154F38|nr:hypothetical protein [Acuticoccus sp. MNP-M23]WMS41509.1 hypothetical protein RDV64_15665 [Acuticoccus sp. MNP-M23]
MFAKIAAECPTIVFVAHGGPLEPQAALLAASLHDAYLPRKIVCRVMEPVEQWTALGDDLTAFLDSLGVEIIPCRNGVDDEYKHGNKIGALGGINGRALFLDTDIMLMTPLSWHHNLTGAAALKPADIDTFSNGGGSWARVWRAFDRDVPPRTLTATISGTPMRPYYNAGFISVQDGDAFTNTWLEVARKIDADESIGNKRPWLDQIALPVTFAELGWDVDVLGDAFNFPCHLADVGDMAPYFAHYHYAKTLAAQPKLRFRVAQLMALYPALAPILSRFKGWAGLVREIRKKAI